LKRYAIGLDFGTLSVRALLADIKTGKELATAVFEYPHGVMDKELPNGMELPDGFALSHPQDYVDGLRTVVPRVLRDAGIDGREVAGIGLDCTSSTVMPVNRDGTPLCLLPEWAGHPHAYVKLWKHHGGEPQAKRMLKAARDRNEPWLDSCGGGIACELLLPKALETAEMDPAVWSACHRYLEMGDWLAWFMTGRPCRSLNMAICNGYYRPPTGYPGNDYWHVVSPGIEPVTVKLMDELLPLNGVAGHLTKKMANELNLPVETPVAAPLIDSHASVLGCGADRAGDMVAVLGTSACYLVNDSVQRFIPGIYSVAYEAHAPLLYGYEGGQSCLGDGLDWFVKQCVPAWVQAEADSLGENVHAFLSRKAALLHPGESGLIALDWLNGVRSPLMRPDLRGVLVGATLHTTPADLYRAVVEAGCFGARRIIDSFAEAGVCVKRVFATGGIPRKNPFLMQVLADACGKEIGVCQSTQASALGSAILGAASSGESLAQCIQRMAAPADTVYKPTQADAYEPLYRRYRALSAVFEQIQY
jgi:L-ribulokinase